MAKKKKRRGIFLSPAIAAVLAVEILEDAKVEFRHEKPKGVVGRSREFWAGWALAQYQWRTGLAFAEIEAFAPLHTILLMYSPYHEMDVTQFFEALDGLRFAASGVHEVC